MEELEVPSELEDSFLQKELILAYKDHIETLKAEISRLKNKYEPNLPEASSIQSQRVPTSVNQKPKIQSVSQLIKVLEQRTKVDGQRMKANEDL